MAYSMFPISRANATLQNRLRSKGKEKKNEKLFHLKRDHLFLVLTILTGAGTSGSFSSTSSKADAIFSFLKICDFYCLSFFVMIQRSFGIKELVDTIVVISLHYLHSDLLTGARTLFGSAKFPKKFVGFLLQICHKVRQRSAFDIERFRYSFIRVSTKKAALKEREKPSNDYRIYLI